MATAISHQYDRQVLRERVQGAFVVPVRVGHLTHAVVYGITRTPHRLGDRVLDAAGASISRLAHELAVEIDVARRLDVIDAERRRLAHPTHTPDPREIREELLSIADTTSDPSVRDRLLLIYHRLAPSGPSSPSATLPLTRRERDVLELIALGMTNNEVADRLSLTPTTVKSYLKHAMRKLGTRIPRRDDPDRAPHRAHPIDKDAGAESGACHGHPDRASLRAQLGTTTTRPGRSGTDSRTSATTAPAPVPSPMTPDGRFSQERPPAIGGRPGCLLVRRSGESAGLPDTTRRPR